MAWVRAGAEETQLPLGLLYVLHRNYEAVNNCDTEKEARQASNGPEPACDGTNAAINHRSNRTVGRI
jgi:hypothetical protein